MIQLFSVPKPVIDTRGYSNLLHDKVVADFEQRFAAYVGAEHAVALNSATTAIFLLVNSYYKGYTFEIPSCIPPVVCNAILTGGGFIKFKDDVDWIGKPYKLYKGATYDIIDSAQHVERDQYKNYGPNDLVIYSFYPTKPVGSSDGGMIVSNDKAKIDFIRTLAYNGMSQEPNNWERKQTMIGLKAYMNAIQSEIAMSSLNNLDRKREDIGKIRDSYNHIFGLENTSDHLYRIKTKDAKLFIEKAKQAGIVCGLHYDAAHKNPIFGQVNADLPKSIESATTMVSIPFHENLTDDEFETVVNFVTDNA